MNGTLAEDIKGVNTGLFRKHLSFQAALPIYNCPLHKRYESYNVVALMNLLHWGDYFTVKKWY